MRGDRNGAAIGWIGVAAVALALLFNEWSVARLLRSGEELIDSTRLAVRLVQAMLLLGGVVLVVFRRSLQLGVLGFNLFLFVVLVAAVEGTFALQGGRWPGLAPSAGPLLEVARELYMPRRALIQYSRDCGQWDSELGYTLRPGECTFRNAEFANRYSVNSAGLRDSEAALEEPEVIVLGDSFAMGWGVEQEEAFPQQLGRMAGLRVLNAGMASYGTAREVLALRRLDTSRLQYLVVQYCSNDEWENRVYHDRGELFETMPQEEYASRVAAQHERAGYRFGDHLITLARPRWRALAGALLRDPTEPAPAVERDYAAEARLFPHVLDSSGVTQLPIPILVLELNEYGLDHDRFLDALMQEAEGGRRAAELVPVYLRDRIGDAHYLKLDDHLTAEGHRVVAEAIAEAIALLGSDL